MSNGFDTSQGTKSAKPLIQHSLTLCSKVAATIDQAQVAQKYINETRDILPTLWSAELDTSNSGFDANPN